MTDNSTPEQASAIQELLDFTTPQDYQEKLESLFLGYLSSDHADDLENRKEISEIYFRLNLFFKQLESKTKKDESNV